jgi:hypothetical protein
MRLSSEKGQKSKTELIVGRSLRLAVAAVGGIYLVSAVLKECSAEWGFRE